MQFHLDPVGGAAGDMFVAALLDAFPEHEAGVRASIAACGLAGSVRCRLAPHRDGTLAGRRFLVEGPAAGQARHDGGHHHAATWRAIREGLEGSALDPAVRRHAVGIFALLADAEARVHGVAVDEVAFHEVGAWDSIADIVAAAHLVAALGAEGWTAAPLPLGSGRVRTAHGLMPVPAPATALLLEGMATVDDGIGGERVTPTGAAILRYLCAGRPPSRQPRRLRRAGSGFGAKTFAGLPNCLRVLCFEPLPAAAAGHREIAVVEFEVDDQSAEDLAMGLDRLRAQADVFDVVQAPVFGKKGRMMTHVRVLAATHALDAVTAACFRETTTIGLRYRTVSGTALPRQVREVEVDGRAVRVKSVERPGGRTAKAEADDALAGETHSRRATLRREAERLALKLGSTE